MAPDNRSAETTHDEARPEIGDHVVAEGFVEGRITQWLNQLIQSGDRFIGQRHLVDLRDVHGS